MPLVHRDYDVDGRLGRVTVRGARLHGYIGDAITSAKLELSSDAITQLTLTFTDDEDFSILDSGLFSAGTATTAGSACDYDKLALEVRAIEVRPRGEDHEVTVTARSAEAGRLRRARGALVRRNLSPTHWAALEAKHAGLRLVGEPSHNRKTIARAKDESSWDTLQRLAQELGYVCFEAAGILYFGKPTWIVGRTGRVPIAWKGAQTDPGILAIPNCRRSGDDPKRAATVDVDLLGELGDDLLPGMGLVVAGVPTFNGLYMVNTVTVDLAEATPVTINASTPVNPVPEPPERKSGSSGGDTSSSVSYTINLPGGGVGHPTIPRAGSYAGHHYDRAQLGNALTIYKVGHSMGFGRHGIIIALSAALQESRLRNVHYGDRDSLGLFQQRASWGSKATRLNPAKSARLFYQALKRVRGWQSMGVGRAAQAVQRSAYPHAYDDEVNDATAILNAIIRTAEAHKVSKNAGSSHPSGRKSARAFVTVALAQAGDRYQWGAETSPRDPNPNAFDCSELVQWAAARVGVTFVDGSSNQRAHCHPISVERAIRTRGALLFHPGHVAISLGNGRTIEAASRRYGVRSFSARGRFSAGGLIPGMKY